MCRKCPRNPWCSSPLPHPTEACRAVSRFLCPYGRQSFFWARHCWRAQATYPRVGRSGPLLPSYLVLLRVGFSLPSRITPLAVRSYRTFSPLPPYRRRCVFCGTVRETRFERVPPAVSRHAALWRPDFPPVAWASPSPARLPARQASPLLSLILGLSVEKS